MKKIIAILIVLSSMQAGLAQNKKTDKAALVKSLIDTKMFVFYPQTAMPMSGNVRQLTPDFDLTINKDTLTSYLPYFGRAYNVEYGATQSPFNFTSTRFDYVVTAKKKGGWDIVITIKDAKEQITYMLSLSASGYGSLQITSTNRQPISFNGYVTELNRKHTNRK